MQKIGSYNTIQEVIYMDIVEVKRDLMKVSTEIKNMIEFIKNDADIKDVKIVLKKLNMAKEYAQIQDIGEQMHIEFLRLEIYCFVKIVKLDNISILHSNKRKAALFFSEKNDKEIEEIIDMFCRFNTATGIYGAYIKEEEKKYWHEEGRKIGKNINIDISADENLTMSGSMAIETALRDFIEDGIPFTIEEVSSRAINYFVGKKKGKEIYDELIVSGIKEICREAIRNKDKIIIEGIEAPRIITIHIEGNRYVRIPIENSNMKQFAQFVKLREKQTKEYIENMAMINKVFNKLSEIKKDDTEQISEILKRINK